MWRAPCSHLPRPSCARAGQALGAGQRGDPAQSRPPGVPELWDRDQTLVRDGDKNRNREGALCFIWLSPSPTSPPQKVAPLLWPPATNQATLCSPTPHIQLVILLSLLAPELQSDAGPGPGLLTFPWMVAQPLPWAPHRVPTQPQWFFNYHFPAQPCPPKLLLALGSTLPPALGVLQALGTCPSCPHSLFSHSCVPPLAVTSWLSTPSWPHGGSLSLCCLFSRAVPCWNMPTLLHSSFLPPSPGPHLLVLKAESRPLFHNPYPAFQS